jgi:hypothetical protein
MIRFAFFSVNSKPKAAMAVIIADLAAIHGLSVRAWDYRSRL